MKTILAQNYAELMARYREFFIFCSAQDVLNWDMMTKLPPRGIDLRSHQVALLSGIAHRMATSPEIGWLLARIEQDSAFQEFSPLCKRNVQLMRKNYDEQVAIPEDLAAEMARQSAITYNTWRKAKAASNWKAYLPELKRNVELAKRKAAVLMEVKGAWSAYDALIDVYESGMTAEYVGMLFDDLRKGLDSLIEKIENAPGKPDTRILPCKIPRDLQRRIAAALAETSSCLRASPRTAAGFWQWVSDEIRR